MQEQISTGGYLSLIRSTVQQGHQQCTWFLTEHLQVMLQFIRGQRDVLGNETAHPSALQIATQNKPRRNTTAHSQPLTFEASKHIISCQIQVAPIQHARKGPHLFSIMVCQVLLASLRTGHCRHLATYHNIIDSSDTVCHKCGASPHRPHTLWSTGCKNASQ